MKLRELLTSRDNDWMLQSLIDTLAISQSIPLRLLHLEELKKLYKHFSDYSDPQFIEKYPNKKAFDTFCKDLVDWADHGFCCEVNDYNEQMDCLISSYNYFSYKFFPILPAQLHSLEFLNQTVIKSWRIFSVLYLYYTLCIENIDLDKEDHIESIFGLKDYTLSFRKITDYRDHVDDEQELYLLVGPVFIQKQEALLDERNQDITIYRNVQRTLNDFAKNRKDNIHIRESYFRQAIYRETIYSQQYVDCHSTRVIDAWNSLLNVKITNKEKDKITPKLLKLLALWALLNNQLHKNNKKNGFKTEDLYLCLSNDECCQGNSSYIYFKSKLLINNQKSKLQLEANFDYQSKSPDLTSFEDYIGGKFLKLHRAFDRKSRQLNSNRLLILELWLNGVFSGLTSEEGEIREQLAAWVCAVMRADIAEIIDYHPEEPKRLLQGTLIFLRKTDYRSCTRELKDKIENLPAHLQEKSSIYRSLKVGKSLLCASRRCNDCKIITYTELELKDIPDEESELVIPIKFNGRVLGVIVAASFTPWRLGISHRSILSSIASQLGTYWYQVRQFGSLKNIQEDILDFYINENPNNNEETLYNKICKQSAMLFLSCGAGLWVKQKNTNSYERKGFHEVEISNNSIDPKKNNQIAMIVRETNQALAAGQSFPHFNIDNFDHLDTENKERLKEQKIQCFHYIPIIDYSSKPTVIAILSIYDNSSQGYDESWKYISQFYSDYLSIVINSIQTHIKNQTTRIALFEHELRDAVSHLTDKARKILKTPTHALETISHHIDLLSNPKFEPYLFRAKLFGELPESFDLKKLQIANNSLRNSIQLPAKDINYLADVLEHKIAVIDQKKLNKYEEAHREEIRSLIAVTDIPDFVNFVVRDNLLNLEEERINLRETINQITEGDTRGIPRHIDRNSLNRTLSIRKRPLELVLRNLWENAQKYRNSPSDTIIIDASLSRTGALLLNISNLSKKYDENELKQLTEPGFRAAEVLNGIEGNSLNSGLGLYLVSNLCRHILGISFKISQKKVDNYYLFQATLRFSPAKIIG